MLSKYNQLVCMDSTHCTNRHDYSLFTLLVQNEFGQGVPVAHLISSDSTCKTLKKFLRSFRLICPKVLFFMTDNDRAEIEAIKSVFPESRRLLCWWHVEKAWKLKNPRPIGGNLTKEQYWLMLRNFLRDCMNFDEGWEEIKKYSTPEFIKYLTKYWLPAKETWSNAFRPTDAMFKRSDTNMLLESFFKTLKSVHFEGVPNRRLDRLIFILTGPVVQYNDQKAARNRFEMNGPSPAKDAFVQEVEAKSLITSDRVSSITNEDDEYVSIFSNEGKDPNTCYLNTMECDCNMFSLLKFCRHLFYISVEFQLSVGDKLFPVQSHIESVQRPVAPNQNPTVQQETDIQSVNEDWNNLFTDPGNDIELKKSVLQFVTKYKNKGKRSSIPPNVKSSSLNFSLVFCPASARGRPSDSKLKAMEKELKNDD